MPLGTLARFLLPPDCRVIKVLSVTRAGARYLVEKTTPFEVCPHCAVKTSSVKDHRDVTVRDSPVRGKWIEWVIHKRRFRCSRCRRVFVEPVSGVRKRSRSTERYKEHVLWACENFIDLEKVKKACRCSTGYVFKALYERLEHFRKKSLQYPFPKTIGIDEHLFRRYKNRVLGWVTCLVDYDHGRLYELVEGKSIDDLKAALGEKRGRENVRFVTMDLSETYRGFARSFFPDAQIVADKFHVVRLFSRLVSRKRIDATGDERANPIRSLLLRRRDDLETHERRALDVYLATHPDVREVYDYKEAMGRIYRMKGAERAYRVFKNLVDRMGRSTQEGVKRLRQTLLDWKREILAYFVTGLTNARTEGFNNKAKMLKRRAFGYKSFPHYRLRLLKACA